jgi:hypothetical protein
LHRTDSSRSTSSPNSGSPGSGSSTPRGVPFDQPPRPTRTIDRFRRMVDETLERRRIASRRRTSETDDSRPRRPDSDRRTGRLAETVHGRDRVRESRHTREASSSAMTSEERSIEHILDLLGVDPPHGNNEGGEVAQQSRMTLHRSSTTGGHRPHRPTLFTARFPSSSSSTSTRPPEPPNNATPARSPGASLRARIGRRLRRRDQTDGIPTLVHSGTREVG